MNEDFQELFKQYIKDNLRLDISTDSYYNGGLDGGQLYTQYHSITLYLEDEVISSVSIG